MNLQDKNEQFKKIITHLREELSQIRTSRARPALLENIKVLVYGAKMPLIQIASITVPEPRQILVEPWDKNVLKDIERAVETTSLGLSVKNEGNFLRISLPQMTEENKKQVIKLLHEKLEKGKISLRALRDEIKNDILRVEKEKEIGEDERYKLIEELDKMTRDFTEQVNEIGKKKEEEIMN